MMSITGTPETAPLRVGYPVADTLGGMTGRVRHLGALVRRERTGEGAFIDVSMLESTLTAMGWAVSNYLIAGVEPRPHRQRQLHGGALRRVPRRRRAAQHRRQQAGAVRGARAALIGRPELAADPRFAERESRKRNRAALTAVLEDGARQPLGRGVGGGVQPIGVPAGRVLTVPQVLALRAGRAARS